MVVSIIAATAKNRVIGRDGKIPWDIPEDRRLFRELTIGNTVIMGRKTYEAIGRALPDRINVVVTRQKNFRADGCIVAHDLAEALSVCDKQGEVFIAGGGELYREALLLADRIYLTVVDSEPEGDTTFPELPNGEFIEIRQETLSTNPLSSFIVYERKLNSLHGIRREGG